LNQSEAKNKIATSIKFPENIQSLLPLAQNMYWVWNRRIRQIFEKIDSAAWEALEYNPIALLASETGRSRLEVLSRDESFVESVSAAYTSLGQYLDDVRSTWFNRNYGIFKRDFLIAYFSMEFALAPCLKTYSGGLGVLSGDHLKSASDLGIPLVAVGLFYRRGYFSQSISEEGWQIESYLENDPLSLPLEPVLSRDSKDEPLVISIPIAERQIALRAWRASVGRVSLYLLDSNVPELNSKEDCEITAELYGGDLETRIKQELVLGVGGARLLSALGFRPSLYHINEGHSAFVSLARLWEIMENSDRRLSLPEAIEIVRASTLFTTHTPVPAGIDVFPRELIEKYLSSLCTRIGMNVDELFSLGRWSNHDNDIASPNCVGSSSSSNNNKDNPGFNMAVLALRFARNLNAVSMRHAMVTTTNWRSILESERLARRATLPNHFADRFHVESRVTKDGHKENGEFEVPWVTNGVHIESWVSDSMAELLDEYVGPAWITEPWASEFWASFREVPDELLWTMRCNERKNLIDLLKPNPRIGRSLSCVSGDALDPNALTIGFARRFATYKRANLILQDPQRLSKILRDAERPVQIIFAGKAHPRDTEGKKVIQQIINFAKSELANRKVTFVCDYGLKLAKSLVSGVDVWLNNPRRPLEACGTSGMKAAINGVLNLSVMDGWWEEGFSPDIGWAIGSIETLSCEYDKQDILDAESLYEILENQVIPEFYERDEQGIPRKWVRKMKNSIARIAPQFNTHRMVIEYLKHLYLGKENHFAEELNKSELGVEMLERIELPWDWEN
jgi:starch phosphorylase